MSALTTNAERTSGRGFWLSVLAYILPTFALGYVWHLVLFAPSYHALQIYRSEVLIPFGVAAMAVQAVIISWAYPRLFPSRGAVLRDGLLFGLLMGALSWSFTTLAVAAKYPMTSIPDYLALETGFTLVQFLIVGH